MGIRWSHVIVVLVSLYLRHLAAYKPIVMMHGLKGSATEFTKMIKLVETIHPGTNITAITDYSGIYSLEALWRQVKTIKVKVQKVMDQNPEGVHFICYSQGGLVCRGLLQTMKHNVDTFISLSSPLAGQFGDTEYMKYFFPKYLKDNIYKLFYTEKGQDISVANYWNDPHHQGLYFKESKYLAVLNNQSLPSNPNSVAYKSNFLRLKKLVLIGGPDDGVITPWQSAHFGFFDEKERIVEFKNTAWFKNDSFGLKTLYDRGALASHTVPGVQHHHWPLNYSVFKHFILPYLT